MESSRSLWTETLPDHLMTPIGMPLDGSAEADVAIVGAGFTGLWTAYFLLTHNPDIRVALIEAHEAGFGASGRNGGWASALFPASLDAVAAMSTPGESRRLKRHMHESIDALARVISDEEWDVDWHKGGTIVFARTPAQWQRARDEIHHMRVWGFGEEDYRLLDAAQAREMAEASDVLGGTFTPHCAALHPGRLVKHLARGVVDRGAILFEHTPAERIEQGVVRTRRGDVRAPIIVRATEGYTRSISGLRRAIAPVYSLMIATEPLPDSTWDAIGLRDRPTFSDGRNLIIYGQRTADGRMAFGGRGAPYHFGSRVNAGLDRHARVHAALRETLIDLFPPLADVRITHEWGGPLGIARDWWASCGFDPRTGLAWSGGYVGDGVTMSHLGGRTLADLILGRDTELTTLPWVGHRSRPWEPEPLRWTGVNAALKAVNLADALEMRGRASSAVTALLDRFTG